MFRGEAAQIIYFPHDLQFSVHRMVTRIHPGLVIIMESDVWPNFVSKMKRLGIPVVFANARISDRSFKIYQRFPWLVGLLFSKFAKICAQSEEDARRFRELGIPAGSIAHTGNLKFDQDAEALSAEELSELRRELAAEPNRRVWVAGSTHAGEEALICKAFKEIQASVGRLLLVVAPRDPGRAGEVRQEFIRSGFSVRYLSEAARAQECEEGPDVVVVDCLGRLRRLYAVADIALVGGSLLCIRGIGGHNPLEPAAYSKPVVFGPNMSDFKEITRLLIETGGCIQVETPEDLSRAVVSVLKDAEHAARMGQRAFHVFCANRGAVDKTFRVVQQYLHPCMESPLLSPEG
jgi:3-deoxy-D-manno-octulosonic-acid transferase